MVDTPDTTQRTRFSIRPFGQWASLRIRVLAALRVPIAVAKPFVGRGTRQTVRIRGLEPAELLTVRWRGVAVAHRYFPAGRDFVDVSFWVGQVAGPGRLRVDGRFPNIRNNTVVFAVR